ncbi:hypothetical protein [Streptomyces sp. UNOC14_S4]|uniref:hypothetical protein n=1 Tax=Streptomyces sp. UNOC14_S4 TaxID=2872340 RepID=UPI001E2A77D1|nr:hypothetical protein [Streptomyces sp. UNOC14_S4]MCC3766477.1 hypothetical protein [Streptomyces sp. UNOC14_S4]
MSHHYHVGCNMIGQEPEVEDIQCAEDEDAAVLALEALLGDQMDKWAERCPYFGTDELWAECSCAWCKLALRIERYSDDIRDDTVGHSLREHGTVSETFYLMEFWIKREEGAGYAA